VPLVLTGGGGGVNVGTYQYLGAVSTIQVVAGSQTLDAVTLTVKDLKFGVVYSFTVPRPVYDGEGWQALAEQYELVVQEWAQLPGTIGMQYVPDTNPSGLLGDYMIVTVGTPDRLNAIDVELELTPSSGDAGVTKINSAWDQIQAAIAAS